MDFLTIGSGIINFVGGIFGDKRTPLTRSALDSAFPSNGFWGTKLKNEILSKIGYVDDLNKILAGTNGITYLEGTIQVFVHKNFYALSDGQWKDLDTTAPAGELGKAVERLYNNMLIEISGGSVKSSDLKNAGGFGNISGSSFALVALAVGGFLLLSKVRK